MKTLMKMAAAAAAISVLAGSLTGCGGASGAISVITREDGSGTRGAFTELCGIAEDDKDNTVSSAEVTNSTAVMLTTVAGNASAIGYVSMGSLDDSVKALNIEGVEATTDNVENGSYAISRPFNIITKESDLSDAAQDFFNYIMSTDAATVITEEGYIPVGTESYTSNGASGSVVVAGSSSVTPVMTKLKEAYASVNPDVSVDVQQSDSTTGVTSTQEGICDIGMASRELKESETGVVSTVMAMDGIAVIVNKDNSVEELSLDQVKQIYTGEITDWSSLTAE
ncbi:substrate-binding domain-containing protein [uncultured Ruminococcus sp.]|uniref:substrate-binding domain-containing protein n=1 Tax=uncultured Ruminococcus sp. TaxID=165186 RepID=UPI00262EC868|nr:substrate-binding domain-containing protein [uncultured Ruminococcus sp.]